MQEQTQESRLEAHNREVAAEIAELKTEDTPVPSPEEQSVIDDVRNAKMTLNDAVRSHERDPLLSKQMEEAEPKWAAEVEVALKEPKGTVIREREELADPVSVMAERAFRRFSPEDQKQASEQGAKGDMKWSRETARKAMDAMFERYPSSNLNEADLEEGRYGELLSRIGNQLPERGSFTDFRGALDADASAEMSSIEALAHVDGVLEQMGGRMAETVAKDLRRTDADAGLGKPEQGEHRRATLEVLPQMKALRDLRKAISKRLFGSDKPPDDVLAIIDAKKTVDRIGDEKTS